MNKKINLIDLTALLAEKASIAKKDAETFLRVYFETMNEELIKSGSLKIKDLGNFKLSLMEDRESIDVTTGERVLIPAHYKVAFVPDKKLAETVNEPFALFETIEIEEEIEPEGLKLFSEDDTLKEPEFIPKDEIIKEEIKEEINFEEEPVFGEEPELEEDWQPEGNPVASFEPDSEEKSGITEQTVEDKGRFTKEKPVSQWNDKHICLNCHDYEAHRIYRNKYFNIRKKLKRLRVIIFILTMIIWGILGFLVYLYHFEKPLPFKKITPISGIIKFEPDKNALPEPDEISNESVVPVEEQEQKETNEDVVSTETSGKPELITVVEGQRLTLIAEKEYGDKAFWIYIYLENRSIISKPDALPVGLTITIPPAEKYGIDCNNPASVQRAKELANRIP